MSEGKSQHPIEKTVGAYITDIESVSSSAPILALMTHAAHKSAHKRHQDFLDTKCQQSTSDGETYYTIPSEYYREHLRLEHEITKTNRAYKLVPRSFIVSLVSQYDFFLGRLVRNLFSLKAESLKSCDRTLKYSDLCSFASIEEAREAIVEEEIETLLRKSHEEQFKWLENKFSIKLKDDLPIWPVFIELTERRNLFVHADGIVSKQYLKNCLQAGFKIEPNVVVGKSLGVKSDYVRRAHAVLYEIGVKLSQVLWRKLDPGSMETADVALNEIGFNLLKQKKYKLAQAILDFASSLPRFSSDIAELFFFVNRANAYKLEGDQEKCSQIIKSRDWSALSTKFQLAGAILSDEMERAWGLMKQIGRSNEMSKNAYRDWPLFESVRQNEHFQKTFQQIFGEPYLIEEKIKQPEKAPEIEGSIDSAPLGLQAEQ